MSENYNTILSELGSYEVKPPDFLTDKILLAVTQIQVTAQKDTVMSAATTIPDDITPEIRELNVLQNFELPAPVFNFNDIAGIKPLPEKFSIEPNKKSRISIWLKAVAAVFIIAAATWVFYPLPNNKNDSTNSTTNKMLAENGDDEDIADSLDAIQKKVTTINVSTSLTNKRRGATEHIKTIRIKNNMPVITEEGQRINISDNDLFLTLVKFNYTESTTFLANIEKTKRIQLDQFSYVTISDKMAGLLAKMYATKRNKKPTNHARKVKAKLEKWKKLDEKNFDNNGKKNPLDIVDLSEFILN